MDLEEERWALTGFGCMGEEADGAIGVLAVEDARAGPAGLEEAGAKRRPTKGPQGRECPPLRTHLFGFERTLFAFARNATAF